MVMHLLDYKIIFAFVTLHIIIEIFIHGQKVKLQICHSDILFMYIQ